RLRPGEALVVLGAVFPPGHLPLGALEPVVGAVPADELGVAGVALGRTARLPVGDGDLALPGGLGPGAGPALRPRHRPFEDTGLGSGRPAVAAGQAEAGDDDRNADGQACSHAHLPGW